MLIHSRLFAEPLSSRGAWPRWLRKTRLIVRPRLAVIKAFKCQALQRHVKQLFKSPYLGPVSIRDECQGLATFVDPAGATDTVDVIIRTLRHIVIDHVRNGEDINTSSGDIRRHENLGQAFTEAGKGSLPLVLG